MKKISLILFLTIFALFIGINVEAKELIGYCEYESEDGWYSKVNLYNNGKVTAELLEYNTTVNVSDISSSNIQRGTCYQHMYVKKTFFNTTVTLANERGGSEGTEYTLISSNSNELSCYYDIKAFDIKQNSVDTHTRLRLHLERKKNGSKIYISALNENNNFENLDLNSTSFKLKTFASIKENGISIYDLSQTNDVWLYFGEYENLFKVMTGSTCPVLYYETYDNAGSHQINIATELDTFDKNSYTQENSNNQYKVVDANGRVTDNVATDASDSAGEVSCIKNGELIDVHASNVENGTLTYNIKFKIDTEGNKQYCVEIDNGYQCTSGPNDHKYALTVSMDDNYRYASVKFQLDKDTLEYLENLTANNFVCPSFLGIYKEGVSTAEIDGTYVITMDSSKATSVMKDGENENTDGIHITPIKPGETEYDCKGLIGDNVLAFLTLILKLIRIVGPILALVLGMWDLFMAMVNGEDDAKKKALKKLKGRIIAAVLLLLLPYLLDMLLHLVNKTGTNCIPH